MPAHCARGAEPQSRREGSVLQVSFIKSTYFSSLSVNESRIHPGRFYSWNTTEPVSKGWHRLFAEGHFQSILLSQAYVSSNTYNRTYQQEGSAVIFDWKKSIWEPPIIIIVKYYDYFISYSNRGKYVLWLGVTGESLSSLISDSFLKTKTAYSILIFVYLSQLRGRTLRNLFNDFFFTKKVLWGNITTCII